MSQRNMRTPFSPPQERRGLHLIKFSVLLLHSVVSCRSQSPANSKVSVKTCNLWRCLRSRLGRKIIERKNIYSGIFDTRNICMDSENVKLLSLASALPRARSMERARLGISVCNGVLRIAWISDLERYGARGKHQIGD